MRPSSSLGDAPPSAIKAPTASRIPPETDFPAQAGEGAAPATIASRTCAPVACGTAPKRIVATPAAAGEAKLVAQPVPPKPPPTVVVIEFSVGAAISTVCGPKAPQLRSPSGALVLTQRTFGRLTAQGNGLVGSASKAPPLPEGMVTKRVCGLAAITLTVSCTKPPSQLMLTTRAPRSAAHWKAAGWTWPKQLSPSQQVRSAMKRALGATPAPPWPLSQAAPKTPATRVPCPEHPTGSLGSLSGASVPLPPQPPTLPIRSQPGAPAGTVGGMPLGGKT